MANTLLTPTMITREALMILHQKLRFVGTINRQYDDRFAQSGAKIGTALQIRLPNEFTVRTGKTLDTQDVTETQVTLNVTTQKGVDMNFTSAELTMDIDDFSERYIEPAMAVLAANIEADALSMYKDISSEIVDDGDTMSIADVLEGGKLLSDHLCPQDGRNLLLNTRDSVSLVTAASGLFNAAPKVSENYRTGQIANQFFGFERVMESSLMPGHTTGTDDGTGDYLVNDTGTIAEASTSLTIDTGAGTWKKGDIFTLDSVFEVHPESKATTTRLRRFVVTADVSASATSISFLPALYSSGAKQNVNAMPANNAKLNKIESDGSTAIGNAAAYDISLGYHRDAFVFATADLVMPKGVDMAAREQLDGISIRLVRQYDINNDNMPCRLDVYYGYKTVRDALAVRFGH